jgi:type I site-specific restriction-modification system R (restriction) subunit
MRNHTLMQTIARANRVYPGKYSGVIEASVLFQHMYEHFGRAAW